jgi:hypothetical protein
MSSKFVLAAALAALAAAPPAFAGKSPAEPAAGAHKQCFWTRDVNNFAAADERTVNVRVGVKDVYQFEMLGRCPDVDWNQSVALVSRGSDYICSGLDAELVTHSPIGPMRCPVKNIHKLSPAEIAALPKRARP